MLRRGLRIAPRLAMTPLTLVPRRRLHRSVLALALASAALVRPVLGGQTQASPVSVSEETLRSFDGRTAPVQILRVTVPLRRVRGTAQTITVAALKLVTTSRNPGNPIVFFMGGPGIAGSLMAPIPPYFTLFEKLRSLGDVVIVDQRGVGRS